MISKRLCIALLCVLAVIFTGYAQVSSKDKKPAPEQPAAKQETTLPATDGKEKKQETAKKQEPAKKPKKTTTAKPETEQTVVKKQNKIEKQKSCYFLLCVAVVGLILFVTFAHHRISKGEPLLLFAHEWSVEMVEKRNPKLKLSEFGRS